MVQPGMKQLHYAKNTPAPNAYYPPLKDSMNTKSGFTSFNTIQGSGKIPTTQI